MTQSWKNYFFWWSFPSHQVKRVPVFSKTQDVPLGTLRKPEETKGMFERPALDFVNSNYDPVFTGCQKKM